MWPYVVPHTTVDHEYAEHRRSVFAKRKSKAAKYERTVGIPLLDDIICDNLIWKCSVPIQWTRCHIYSVLTSLIWLDKIELRIWGQHIWERRDWWCDDRAMVIKRQKSVQDIFKAHRLGATTTLVWEKDANRCLLLRKTLLNSPPEVAYLFLSCLTWIYHHHHHPHIYAHPRAHLYKFMHLISILTSAFK